MSDSLPTSATPESTEEKPSVQREIFDFAKLVVWFLLVFLVLRTYVLEGYEVQGDSMSPNLENNDRILVFKLPHTLSQLGPFSDWQPLDQGDIVVFDSPDNANKRYVKRVIAAGPPARADGTVAAKSDRGDGAADAGVDIVFDRGRVYVNNHVLVEDYLVDAARVSADQQTLRIGPGEYYVLGDNRGVSKDSRSFDAIGDQEIVGKAVFRFWPLHRISFIE